jgi:hypothetical protein
VGDFAGIQTLKNKLVNRGRRVAVGKKKSTGEEGEEGGVFVEGVAKRRRFVWDILI